MQPRFLLPGLVLLATGCSTSPKPAVPSIELSRFSSCGELETHLIDSTVEMLVSSMFEISVDIAFAEEGGDTNGGPSSYSGTNLQEAAVDEPDLVKTNGNYIFAAKSDALSIVKSWPVEEAKEVAEVDIEGSPSSLFLHGDRAIVFSQNWDVVWPGESITGTRTGATRVTIVDVSDRTSPEVLREIDVEGTMLGARMVGEQMVLSTRHYPHLPGDVWETAWRAVDDMEPWGHYYLDPTGEVAKAIRDEARDRIRPLVTTAVQSMPSDSYVLSVRDNGKTSTAAGCTQVYHSDDLSTPEMMSLVHIDMGATGPGGKAQAQTIMAGGTTMYASEDHIYIAQGSNNWWWGWGNLDRNTRIHRFDLEDEGTAYTASGEVPGWLHNQFSMSEHEGLLRVATTYTDWWWGTSNDDQQDGNNVYILDPGAQGQMQIIGAIEGLAPGERIYAARFQGEKGYLVTFRQIDPLFTLDLSDPTNPQAIGELKIPGYSAYLHPRGKERLIGVGMDGTDEGQITGVSVSLFDVSDFSDPTEVDRVTVGSEWGSSEALWDHHAITVHEDLLTVPFQGYESDEGYIQGLLVVDIRKNSVDEHTRITHRDLVYEFHCGDDPECWDKDIYSGDSQIRRAIVMDDYLFSVSNFGILVSDLANGDDNVASVVYR